MAEVTINASVNTETNDGKDGHLRRFSTGNVIGQTHVAKVKPHYLSASSGSCHDLCKYGINGVPETNLRRSLQRRNTETSNQNQDLLRSVMDSVQRKQSATTFTNAVDFTSKTAKNREVIKKEIPEYSKKATISLRRQTSSPAELKSAAEKQLIVPKPKTSSLPAKRHLPIRHSEINLSAEAADNTMNSQIITCENLHASEERNVDTKPKTSKTKASVFSGPKQLSRRQREIIRPKGSEIRRISSLGSLSRRNNDVSMTEEVAAFGKPSIDFKGKPRQPKSFSPLPERQLTRRHGEIIILNASEPLYVSAVGNSSGQRTSKTKMNKESEKPKMENKKELVRERISSSSKSSPKRILSTQSEYVEKQKKVPSTFKIRNRVKEVEGEQPGDENVIEKALYVTEQHAENLAAGLAERGISLSPFAKEKDTENGASVEISQSPPIENSFPNDTPSSVSTSTSESSTSLSSEARQDEDSAFGIDKFEIENQITDLEEENIRTPKIGEVSLEDKDWSPSHKLLFRSGSIIDSHLVNRTPTRLKFRQGKVLAENQIGISDIRGRGLRRLASDGVLYESKSENVNISLKHQEIETRKETQSLFNNVIEETANKLVQSRKSKVKALVGAFETVFCHQDTKSMEISTT